MCDICKALSYLHSLGKIHMDIKPANIIIRPNGAQLIDFNGTMDEPCDFNSVKSQENAMFTTLFASPEVLFASSHITRAHDIWSLGITILLYL